MAGRQHQARLALARGVLLNSDCHLSHWGLWRHQGVLLLSKCNSIILCLQLRLQRAPSFVRLYRDYSLADICFCALLTTATAAVSFRPGARAIVCEEISGQPELLRDLADAGLNVENCEQWFEHAVLGFVGVTAILLIVRVSQRDLLALLSWPVT